MLFGVLGALLLGCGNAQESKADISREIVATWNLHTLSDNGNAIRVEAGEQRPSITFSADQQFNGNAGCNAIFGMYQLVDGKLQFGGGAGMTRKMCAPESMAIEDALTKIFSTTNLVRIEGNTLILQSGSIKATFSK